MIKQFTILILITLFAGDVTTDCRGCCSHHKGVVCLDGKTKCGDGTPLSAKCRKKGCSVCEDEQTDSSPETPKAENTAYDRSTWPHWIDADNDCQDTRSEILQRDNVGTIKWKRNKPCNVSWGKWVCPYTGKVLTKASDVDIDHVVPLSHAHSHGAANWTREQKRAFANDPMNLLAVDDATNQEKSDKGPGEWMPPRKEYWGEYLKRWQAIKKKYNLTSSDEEKNAIKKMKTFNGARVVDVFE